MCRLDRGFRLVGRRCRSIGLLRMDVRLSVGWMNEYVRGIGREMNGREVWSDRLVNGRDVHGRGGLGRAGRIGGRCKRLIWGPRSRGGGDG